MDIQTLEKEYTGKKINIDIFFKKFVPNGSSKVNFVNYFDLEDFLDDYKIEDPRAIDYPPIESDDSEEERYLSLDYPDISLFVNIKTDVKGNNLIGELSICKVYSTGCMTAGAHSNILIASKAERIKELIDSALD